MINSYERIPIPVSLFPTLVKLLDRMVAEDAKAGDVIAWGAPVPAFGNPDLARVATLGLNPSNREFVDTDGVELSGDDRRFHTLHSLGLSTWDQVEGDHLDRILTSCTQYFAGNPYDQWFRRLDGIISATGSSYYSAASPACHLDIIPYATSQKWTALSNRQRAGLLRLAGDTLALLLSTSAIRVLILNGQSVVSYFEEATGIQLTRTEMQEWALPRQSGNDVPGFAYQGSVETMSGYALPEQLLVLGFNHNLQSSYGVTSKVLAAIRSWIGRASRNTLSPRRGSLT